MKKATKHLAGDSREKPREMGQESTNGKIVGVIFFAWFLYSVSLSLSLSLALSRSLSLSLSFSLLSISLSLTLIDNYIHAYMCLTVGRQSRDHRPLSRDPSVSFYKSFLIAWNVQKRCLTVSRRSCDLRPLSRDRSATFFKKISNCLKRPKNVVWQSADGRVTSDHCRVTVQRLFSKWFFIAWNVQKTLFDSRSTVAWPQPLSRDRSATFFKNFANRLKRPKNVVWQSADGRVTSDHCRVTVQRLFSKKILIAWNVEKSLFDSRPTVAWPPTTVAWPFSDFFQNFRKSLETSRKRCLTVGRRSRDLRLLSRDRSVTFFKNFPNCLKRPKNVVWQSADGRVTPTTVAWPFSDFFQNFFLLLETSKKRCLTVGRRSLDLRPLSRDRSAFFFINSANCLKRPKNVVWQSADGRVTSTTVAWPFTDFFQNFPKSLRKKRDLRPLSRDRLATFFKKKFNCLKRRKIVVWQSADSRVTSDHCRVTVQRLFSKFSQIARNVQKTLFDSRPTVAWPPTTVAWQFSDFFQKMSISLETSKNVIWQLPDGRVTTEYCRLTVQRLLKKKFPNCFKRPRTLFDSRSTFAWPPFTVAWLRLLSSVFVSYGFCIR